MPRCISQKCHTWAGFNAEGTKTPAYCKRHAKGGMVNICSRRCLYASCTTLASYYVYEETSPLYCKQHARDGMLDVRNKRCSHASCTTRASYNVEGKKSALYCKQHAGDGMVNVRSKRCSYDSRTPTTRYNLEAKYTTKYYEQYTQYRMVNVHGKRCIFHGCKASPCFDVKGMRPRLYCQRHTEDDMIDVREERNFFESSAQRPPKAMLSRAVCPSSRQYPDISDQGVISGRKRLRSALDKNNVLGGPVEGPLAHGEVFQSVGRRPSPSVLFTPPSGTVGDHRNDTLFPTAAKGTQEKIQDTLCPVTNGEPSVQSIKIELGLTINL